MKGKKILPPILFIITGHLGVGKTTTAHILGKLIGAPVASVDQVIKSTFDKPSNLGKDKPFNDFEIKTCYKVFALLAEYMLSSNNSIIIDGAFAKNSQRKLLISITKKLGISYYILYVTCPDDIIKERASKRYIKGKGVGWKAHSIFKKNYEPLKLRHSTIDSSENIKSQLIGFLKNIT